MRSGAEGARHLGLSYGEQLALKRGRVQSIARYAALELGAVYVLYLVQLHTPAKRPWSGPRVSKSCEAVLESGPDPRSR